MNHVDEPEEEQSKQKINYTKTIKRREIFKENTKDINIAILAFTILDFFMSQPKNREDDPLSKSKSFLLEK